MILKRMIFFCMALCLLTVGMVQADIYSNNNRDLDKIRITLVGKDKLKFEYCQAKTKDCDRLGWRNYTVQELRKLRNLMKAGAISAGVADIAVVGIAIVGGGVVGAIAAHGSAAPGIYGFFQNMGGLLAGGTVGAGAGTLFCVFVKKFNPVYRWKRAELLQEKTLDDEDIPFHGSVRDLADALDGALKRLK